MATTHSAIAVNMTSPHGTVVCLPTRIVSSLGLTSAHLYSALTPASHSARFVPMTLSLRRLSSPNPVAPFAPGC